MSWRDRLAVVHSDSGQKCPDEGLPKLPKAPFVAFVSAPDGHFTENGPAVRPGADMRAHLLALAADELLPEALVHRLRADDVAACIGLPDATLRTYLRALDRRAMMEGGQCPPDYSHAVQCDGCGPVWLWPDCPPHVLACPWCAIRKAGRYLPRPRVTCGPCQHFAPDDVNPSGGCGACGLGLPYRRGERGRYPFTERHCAEFRPTLR